MRYKIFLLLIVHCQLFQMSFSQQGRTGSVSGYVRDNAGNPVPGASVILLKTTKAVSTDIKGYYIIEKVGEGDAVLEISAIGYAAYQKKITLKAGEKIAVNSTISSTASDLEEVAVLGRTANQEVNRQAYNVIAIDAKKLHNSTLDIAQALDRVSGIRVRESGGVGSDINFSLNGFSGNKVKFFLDGVPMENFGSSFQINSIPINLAERVEVYKGVVPIWLGGDAIGGAVNIVTSTHRQSYLDASYSFGSFNTHRTTLNTGYIAASGFTVQINAFQNYSRNNYKVDVEVEDMVNQTGRRDSMRVKRFHDTYHNETVIANIGVVGKKYADRLLIGATLGKYNKEIQNGNRMYDVYGGRYTRGNTIMPSVLYVKKDLFTKGLDVRMNVNFNLGESQSVDTSFRRYNWIGQSVPKSTDPSAQGGELSRTLRKFKNNNGILNFNINYQINGKQHLLLNNVFTTFDRVIVDPLFPENIANQQPRKVSKNVTGLGYRYDFNTKWNATAFLKEYLQWNTTYTYLDQKYTVQKGQNAYTGWGLATSYYLFSNVQLKASYERAYRIPENEELFGDEINLISNFSLKPEMSHNINAGITYDFMVHKEHKMSVNANYIFRNSADYIRSWLRTSGMSGAEMQYINSGGVTNRGVDAEFRYSFRNLFTAGISYTYQDLRNDNKYEPGSSQVSEVYRDRIPNIPYSFGNANATWFVYDLGAKGNVLTIGYNFLFVDEFYLNWPSRGTASTKLKVPQQIAHDANVVYSMAKGKYNVAFECRNMTDATLYDNFSLQKPSRSFNIKLRYYVTAKRK